jgi:hypothetical protein
MTNNGEIAYYFGIQVKQNKKFKKSNIPRKISQWHIGLILNGFMPSYDYSISSNILI